MNIQNQVAIVTGGSGAIGGAIARQLAAVGAHAAIFDLNPDTTEKTVAEIRNAGGSASGHPVDVGDPDAVQAEVNEVFSRHRRIDILVNCAGFGPRKQMRPFHEQSIDFIHHLIQVNLFGNLYCTHAAVPHMVAAHSGRIINIASIVGVQGRGMFVEYSAAKGAVIAATKSLAKELGPHNITVNCVSPGQIRRKDEMPADPRAFARQNTVLNRIGTPDDIAGLVLHLTLPEAGFITGQNYIVDGGRSLGMMGSDLRV